MSDYIPEEHVLQILKLLPVRSLLRFRCVSKGWKQLIDSPSFTQEYFSPQNPSFLLQSEKEYFVVDPDALPSIKRLNSPIQHLECSLLATHHGVVCLFDSSDLNILLWNPSISRFSPRIPLPSFPGFNAGALLKGCYGFWIDPFTKEFKFVAHNYIYNDVGVVADSMGVLYSSIRQDWRLINRSDLRNWYRLHRGPPLMIQGVAHWEGFRQQRAAGVILSFDFVLERFEHIQMPDLEDHGSELYCNMPFLWQGNLSILRRDLNGSIHDMYARQHDEWVKIFGFDLQPTEQFPHCIRSVSWVLVEEEEEERRMALVVVVANQELFLYDITGAAVICLVDEFSNALVLSNAYMANDYVGSFLFP